MPIPSAAYRRYINAFKPQLNALTQQQYPWDAKPQLNKTDIHLIEAKKQVREVEEKLQTPELPRKQRKIARKARSSRRAVSKFHKQLLNEKLNPGLSPGIRYKRATNSKHNRANISPQNRKIHTLERKAQIAWKRAKNLYRKLHALPLKNGSTLDHLESLIRWKIPGQIHSAYMGAVNDRLETTKGLFDSLSRHREMKAKLAETKKQLLLQEELINSMRSNLGRASNFNTQFHNYQEEERLHKIKNEQFEKAKSKFQDLEKSIQATLQPLIIKEKELDALNQAVIQAKDAEYQDKSPPNG